jgi:hypothetical protein
MGRISRLKRERRERRQRDARQGSAGGQPGGTPDKQAKELEDRLKELSDGEFESSCDLPPEVRNVHLEDILAFESVSTGTSLFQGLEAHGVSLPRPDTLDDPQCAEKAREVLSALARLRVFLVGFDRMSPREFYSTLWNETLWEGCYVEKRLPGAVTLIDVSHSMSRADWRRFTEELKKSQSVH